MKAGKEAAFIISFILLIYFFLLPASFLLSIIILLIGGIALILGSDFFVDGAAGISSNLGISEHAVGLTMVAFGTSFPEFAVSVIAAFENHKGIAVGNVLGSNISNIFLIMGIAMILMPLKQSKFALNDSIFMFLLSIITVFLSFKGFNYYDGLIFLASYAIFIYILYKRKSVEVAAESMLSFPKSILFLIGGGAGVLLGGNAMVDGAAHIARAMGIDEIIIAATIISFGTSLPELMTSITATLKNHHGIAIGNIIGSNIVNIGIVLGTASLIRKTTTNSYSIIIFFLLSAFLSTVILYKRWLKKETGIIFLILYILYVTCQFL